LDSHSAECLEPRRQPLPLVASLGDGHDRIHVRDIFSRATTIYGEGGNDTAQVSSHVGSSPLLDGGAGDDDLSTNMNCGDAPILRGGPGEDALLLGQVAGGQAFGGEGDDRIGYSGFRYGQAPLRLDGGDGNDTYTFHLKFAPETIVPSRGLDTLDESTMTYLSRGLDFDMSICPACVEVVIGTPFGDRITGDAHPQAIFGGGGDDVLDGNGGPDAIAGQDGNDAIAADDGMIDAVGCGSGSDAVVADRRDLVNRFDCESVTRVQPRI
jgi:Ca2+-binding RTX toxin-like protein